MTVNQSMNIAIIQMHIEVGNIEENRKKLEQLLNKAVNGAVKPDVILFPEMWNTGYALTEITELADLNGNDTKTWMSAFAAKHQVNIVAGSIAELKEDGVYNTIYAFDRSGAVIGDYSKLHLFRLMDEHKYLKAGDKLGQLNIDGVEAGMMICYDIRFPELFRHLALEGAKVMFVPAEWPNPRLHHWRTLLMARAIENQMYVVASNRMGTSGKTEFFGHSMIIDPWGEIIAEAREEEGIITGQLDLALVDTVRSTIPVFNDRRPEQYMKK